MLLRTVLGTWSLLLLGWWVLSGIVQNGQAWSQETIGLTARQVVEQWLESYPQHLHRAVALTTSSFREGMSQEEWVATRGLFLKGLGLKYVRAKVVNEEFGGHEAHVMVQAHIVTMMGDQPQDELYILVSNPGGGWLIDQVEVYTESFNRVP